MTQPDCVNTLRRSFTDVNDRSWPGADTQRRSVNLISHPYDGLARQVCQLMTERLTPNAERGRAQVLLPFITYTVASV